MREEEAAFARSLSDEQRYQFNLLFETENRFLSQCGILSFLVGLNTRLLVDVNEPETAKRRPHPNAPPQASL